jgi:hypothetical protein
MKSRLDLAFVAQPRNRPPTSSCCSCHHAARSQPRWPLGPSNEAYLSSPHLEASPATTFRACSSPAPTRVKTQPAPAILSQESVHTTLSITHHTRKRPSTGPRTTHGPHKADLEILSSFPRNEMNTRVEDNFVAHNLDTEFELLGVRTWEIWRRQGRAANEEKSGRS